MHMIIRPAAQSDAAAIAGLLEELGYPQPVEFVHNRLDEVFVDENQAVFVAEEAGEVLGFVAFLAFRYFHAEGLLGRMIALSVTDQARGKGVGRALVDESERFARTRGCTRMEVTTALHRVRTHNFYEDLGYTETHKRYIKAL